ncbi:MAG: DNA double-strand break repair nuclease NurA [Candidatus Micrarchaeota archaeon]|nr:DNA double-strand break repair nuclease NurA [Candidatus Micrarchaeota archaeon]
MQIKSKPSVILLMLDSGLEEIAKKISESENEKRELAKRLRFNSGKIEYPETLEKSLFYPVGKVSISCKVAAVDSGIIGEELHGFDFLLLRAAGVIFEYRASKVISHTYFPSAIPNTQYDVRSGLDSYEVIWHKSLFRLKSELSCASKLIAQHSPDYLLLDGSIAPLLSDRPPEESEIRPLYNETVEEYRKLYQAAWEKNCTLLGVIKDSRSRRFIEIVSKHTQGNGFANTNDTNFLFFMLNEGERTCAFSYAAEPQRHQIIKELGQWGERILAFYLKPVKDDRPLRVEFLSGQRGFDEIASFVHSLSCLHKSYAYPPVLIEADLRAALDGRQFEQAYGSLFSRLGRSPALMRLRRNARPFR